MKRVKRKELDVDFISEELTVVEKKMISEYIAQKKQPEKNNQCK